MLCLVFISCNNSNSPDANSNNTSTDTSTDTAIDTSIQVEYDAERESSDNEFPFDNIIVERNGYDIVSAGKYYGSDFDNVKYYGSYYRIIDNYENFSEITQWGEKIDKSVFNNNFVLVLYSYTKCSVYYSHPEFHELNGIGQFFDFKFDVNNSKISISETHSINGMNIDKDGYVPPKIEDYTVVFPSEKQETIYLLIPKDEMPNNLPINGEISFYEKIIIEE